VQRLGLGLTFDQFGPKNMRELIAHYRKKELTEGDDPEGLAWATKECRRLLLTKWIEPRWGNYPLCKVKAVEVEDWLDGLEREIVRTVIQDGQKVKQVVGRKPLAPGSKKKLRDILHVLFGHAIRYEWAERNPISSVRQGGKRQCAPELIDVRDLSKLIFEVLGSQERVMVFLDFGSGLRRGELSGIKWEDINFEVGQLLTKRSVVHQHIGPTKTEASQKPIPLDDNLLTDLKAWRAATPYAADSDYVFASPTMDGKQPYWLDSFFKKRIKPAAAKAGIHLKGWHTLRHTYSTLLKSNGNDPKVVQELLRHAKFSTTMDDYTQALSPEKRRAHRGVIRLVVPRQAPRRVAQVGVNR
jgi:integrase